MRKWHVRTLRSAHARADRAEAKVRQKQKSVTADGLEPPTSPLQSRCATHSPTQAGRRRREEIAHHKQTHVTRSIAPRATHGLSNCRFRARGQHDAQRSSFGAESQCGLRSPARAPAHAHTHAHVHAPAHTRTHSVARASRCMGLAVQHALVCSSRLADGGATLLLSVWRTLRLTAEAHWPAAAITGLAGTESPRC